MSDAEISADVKSSLLKRKLQLWYNTLYDAQIDARIAETLEDQQMKDQAAARMKQAHKAIDLLKNLLGGEK